MDISEKDIEDMIFSDIRRTGGRALKERGFNTLLIKSPCYNAIHWQRQVTIPSYGIADIIGYTRYEGVLFVDVIELKNRPLKSEDFDQVFRYATAIEHIVSNSFKELTIRIKSYLVGPSIESGHYIHNNCPVGLYTFQFGIDGFRFEKHTPQWIKPSCESTTIKDLRCADQIVLQPIPQLQASPTDN